MKKTLLYFEEAQLRELRRRAKDEGRSLASVAREAVDRYLVQKRASPLGDFVGCAETFADDDGSERADQLVREGFGALPLETPERGTRRRR